MAAASASASAVADARSLSIAAACAASLAASHFARSRAAAAAAAAWAASSAAFCCASAHAIFSSADARSAATAAVGQLGDGGGVEGGAQVGAQRPQRPLRLRVVLLRRVRPRALSRGALLRLGECRAQRGGRGGGGGVGLCDGGGGRRIARSLHCCSPLCRIPPGTLLREHKVLPQITHHGGFHW